MSSDDQEFRIRPGRGREAGAGSQQRGKKLAAQVRRAAARSGFTRSRRGGARRGGTGRYGRGRHALAAMRRSPAQRRVTVMARIVRHKGAQFRSAPLARHIAYLERDGVTRDGRDALMFDAAGDAADRAAFAERCGDDRHHFRLIVSPEDAAELEDLRRFTRDLMRQMERDLDTALDWVAVDHWNTDNPHVHVLVRGVVADGADLVIDRTYVAEGIRGRASEIVTLELGPRTERDIERAQAREVGADGWTGLDAELVARGREMGIVDLRPERAGADADRHLRGRAARLEVMGLATKLGPGLFQIDPEAETALRRVGERGDIIKTMHREMRAQGLAFDVSALALDGEQGDTPITGRLVARGLDDELAGSAFAIVDGVDGRTHHIRFADLEWTGDAAPGAIVELRRWGGRDGGEHLSLAVRSDLPIGAQVSARGATWLDRQWLARDPVANSGFGRELQQAMKARAEYLERAGLARRHGGPLVPERGLIETLRRRDLEAAGEEVAARTGLAHRPLRPGERMNGIYRERITLASGRFAMIDDGLGFQLVPWRSALERHLGKQVGGTMTSSGGIDWALGRGRGIGI
jgi:type IV secretory pathway VirD2 relaxase